jgi:hypothetical protein
MQRKFGKAVLGVILLGAVGATAASAAPAEPAATGGTGIGLGVVVQNKATQVIPVGGTVNVGNLPAVQNVNGSVNVGNLPAVQNVRVSPPTSQVLMQASAELTDNGQPGLTYVKLLNELTGAPSLSGHLAVSSVTISQFGGSQPIQVSLRAASCDNSNGLGAIGDVVVPQNQTVQLPYPTPVLMPFVPSVPASWCLFAQTVADNGSLSISVVGTPTS